VFFALLSTPPASAFADYDGLRTGRALRHCRRASANHRFAYLGNLRAAPLFTRRAHRDCPAIALRPHEPWDPLTQTRCLCLSALLGRTVFDPAERPRLLAVGRQPSKCSGLPPAIFDDHDRYIDVRPDDVALNAERPLRAVQRVTNTQVRTRGSIVCDTPKITCATGRHLRVRKARRFNACHL
jgi:hypothetical protein